MRLFIVRHAKAFDRDPVRWPDDSKRPLTADGRKEFRRLARRIGRWLRPPERVLASSWDRAWETAKILEEEAMWPAAVREPLLEDVDESHAASGLLEHLGAADASGGSAIVGHEPFLSRFAGRLLCGRADGVVIDLRKGAVLELDVDPQGPLGATLCSLAHPKLFAKR